MREPVFLLALAIVATTAIMVVRTIAGAISGRRSSASVARLQEQVDQQAAALEDAQQAFADQARQLSELQERMDFAERMLTQGQERSRLRPGE